MENKQHTETLAEGGRGTGQTHLGTKLQARGTEGGTGHGSAGPAPQGPRKARSVRAWGEPQSQGTAGLETQGQSARALPGPRREGAQSQAAAQRAGSAPKTWGARRQSWFGLPTNGYRAPAARPRNKQTNNANSNLTRDHPHCKHSRSTNRRVFEVYARGSRNLIHKILNFLTLNIFPNKLFGKSSKTRELCTAATLFSRACAPKIWPDRQIGTSLKLPVPRITTVATAVQCQNTMTWQSLLKPWP